MASPQLYYAATARADRAEDGLAKVEAIADAFVTDPGCEMNVVDKVEAMGHMIQQLRQDKHALLNAR
jgi:hypothetical protein